MATLIRFKRGPESALLSNSVTLSAGEPAFTTDTRKLYIGGDNTGQTKIEVGNRNVPFITTLVNQSSAYFPNTTTPLQTDFVSVTSYGNTFQGILYTGNTTKWVALDTQASNGAMLTLTLCAAKFFGKALSPSQFPQPLRVRLNPSTGIEGITYDGYPGEIFIPNNYCRYINRILRSNNQFTVLSGTPTGARRFAVAASRCIHDDFYLEFEERLTGMTINDSRFRNRYLYALKTVDSNTIEDSIGFDVTSDLTNVLQIPADDRIWLYEERIATGGSYTNQFARWKKVKNQFD